MGKSAVLQWMLWYETDGRGRRMCRDDQKRRKPDRNARTNASCYPIATLILRENERVLIRIFSLYRLSIGYKGSWGRFLLVARDYCALCIRNFYIYRNIEDTCVCTCTKRSPFVSRRFYREITSWSSRSRLYAIQNLLDRLFREVNECYE